MIVLDASVALSLVLPDEKAPPTLQARDLAYAVVPTLWIYEVASGLRAAERRGRIAAQDSDRALRYFHELHLEAVHPNIADTMVWARTTGLTVYDASYLVIARALDATLCSNDDALVRAARAQGIDLYSG